ncbi:hypothetical protein LguiA_016654 [Lonicera macranthoides]
MPKQYHLPPRYPFQKKHITHLLQRDLGYPQHHRTRSQCFISEEQPEWLNDLLSDNDSTSKVPFHRRSSSDSVTLVGLPSPKTLDDEEHSGSSEACIGLESACTYGPNSPRRKGKLPFTENAIVSAFSEYASQNPMQHLDGLCIIGTVQFESVQHVCGSGGEVNDEIKPVKRHTGQRSRVRKLQYIAELERTVNVFQALESELAVKVDSLLQQRAALSMENSKLKQKVARLQEERLIVNGQYRSLRKEVERLKNCPAYSGNNKASTNFRSTSATEVINSEANLQMLNLGKLGLN